MYVDTLSDYFAPRANIEQRIASIINADKKPKITRNCKRCEKEFTVDWDSRTYCAECGDLPYWVRRRDVVNESQRRRWALNHPKKPPVIKNCAYCGKEFSGSPMRLYCGNACNTNAYFHRKKDDPSFRQKYIERSSRWKANNLDKVTEYKRRCYEKKKAERMKAQTVTDLVKFKR
jgi:hypothetical protein